MVKIMTAPDKIAKLTGVALIFCLFNIFYLGFAFAANSAPKAVAVSPSSGYSNPDQEVYFVTSFSDANGGQDIYFCYFVINTSTSFKNCFTGQYNNVSNRLYLMDDTGVRPLGGYAPGSNSPYIQNSYCILDPKKTSVSKSATGLYVRWCVTFKPKFTGLKNSYLYARDKAGANTGWVKKGTWTIRPPTLSLLIDPKLWDIGQTEINKTITMNSQNKITVTNNGLVTEAFSLSLINPAGWTAANVPAQDTYVVSGLFCAVTAAPTENNFNKDSTLYEDAISTTSKKATQTIFGFNNSTTNGASVPKGQSRALYLQFQSPTLTDEQEEKNISVIVNCEIP